MIALQAPVWCCAMVRTDRFRFIGASHSGQAADRRQRLGDP
jgi:hypothetical protein